MSLKVLLMREPLKPELEVIPFTVIDPNETDTAPTFLATTVIIGFVVLGTNVATSIAMLDCAAWFCAPCWLPVEELVCDRKPWLHMKMITDIATATAIISRVASTGATAFRFLLYTWLFIAYPA